MITLEIFFFCMESDIPSAALLEITSTRGKDKIITSNRQAEARQCWQVSIVQGLSNAV